MKRTIVLKILVNKKERAEIKRRVPMGMTLSGYLRWAALREPQVDERLLPRSTRD